ncbi:MAG TPA: RDD family protein, partial [Holophaga sp.]|nr:RDD family protein [Holophaga sp.]
MIDSARAIETPEGVVLELRPAGPVVRALAWGIDTAVRLAVYMALGMVAPLFGGAGIGSWMVLMFLLEWFYPVIFEVKAKGRTPGKMALGIRVLCDDGTPVGWFQSTIRNFLRFADFLPALYGAGLVSMLVARDFKRLGDLAAGTIVVYEERWRQRQARPALAEGAARAEALVLPAVPLTLDEQQALVAFAARRGELTVERGEE